MAVLLVPAKTLHQRKIVTRELADLPAGRDVPNAHRVVLAGADDLCAVAAERYLGHGVFVPRQRVHLQNTPDSERVQRLTPRLFLPGNPNPTPSASPSARCMAAHLDSGLDVPDLHELISRPADDASAVPRESDGPHTAPVTRKRAHLPPTHRYTMGGPGKWWGFLSGLWYQEGL